ncbi:uncharacterized protein [Watersipora subatra]|uniref:uncharacterized protein n=1 Tax=Watersipora subatra TaxID=2589382 RepID=UPI00355B0A61
MAMDGWFTQLARTVIANIRKLADDPEAEESSVVPECQAGKSKDEVETTLTSATQEKKEAALKDNDDRKISPAIPITSVSSPPYRSPFEGYHLDMSGFYAEAIKSLPTYRRNSDQTSDWNVVYVQNHASDIPCSPRLVQKEGKQKRVVTRMLRSYPQADGSFVCPIPQPGNYAEQPPPLPLRDRDQHNTNHDNIVKISSGNRPRAWTAGQSIGHPEEYDRESQEKPLLYQSNEGSRRRSLSYQSAVATNEVRNREPYTRMNSDPISSRASSTLIISTENAQPLHTITTLEPSHSVLPSHHLNGLAAPLHRSTAIYLAEPAVRITRSNSQLSNISENSASTYTESMESSIAEAPTKHDTPEREVGRVNARPSSGYTSSATSTGEPKMPELYPEQRVDIGAALRIPARSRVKMSCFDMLHNAHHVLEFLNHKVDILEQSLRLFSGKLSEMSDLAVTMPSCTQVDTEFCICHHTFDTARLTHSIWKYFCDPNKCNFCCQLFEQLANRPNSVCQLSVLDLNLNLILSEALIITGMDDGGLVVFIRAQLPVWSNCDEDCLLDLSNFLEYISSTVRDGLISVIVDSRRAPDAVTQLIMDSLQNAQKNSKGGIAEVSVIVDRPSHTPKQGILTSRPGTSAIKIDCCSLHDCVLKLSPNKLPEALGGTYQFDPDSWIRSYACLEKKIQQHQRAFGDIFSSTHNLSLVPRTIRHAGNVVHQHKNSVDVIDRTIKQLDRSKYTEEGSRYPSDIDDVNACNILRDAEIRQLLDDLNTFMTGTQVFRDVMDSLQSLGETRREVSRLKVLAEARLAKLHECRQLWFCIEEITKTLTLLRRAHDLINKHRVISNNLKSAQVQFNNFSKIKPSVMKLVVQGNELLADAKKLLTQVASPIPWLEELSAKLHSELSFLSSVLEKTELLITDTFHCYKTLDQAYDWAVESMKFVSSMNMDECLSEEGVEKLSSDLSTFIKSHKMIDKKVFDDVAVKARNLGNKKLIEQSRIARSRCEETKQVLKVRETTIVKAKEEIEAQRAKRISLKQLAADTNITPLKTSDSPTSPPAVEDIWLPQSVIADDAKNNDFTDEQEEASDDTNNNLAKGREKQNDSIKCIHVRTKSADTCLEMVDISSANMTSSVDTMASSSQGALSQTGSQSDLLSESSGDKKHQVSPIILPKDLNEGSMAKRRSFAGFANSTAYPSFNDLAKMSKVSPDKRLSGDTSELDEGLVTIDDDSSCHSTAELTKSVVEKLEELGIDRSTRAKTKGKDASLRDSVITGSSDSLTSFHEDHEVLTEDSGALTKSSSSTASHDSQTNNQWSPVPVNSHLMQKKSSHQWQSMSDLRLTECEIRSRRTLSHIMNELIQTEKDYVMALQLVVERYIPEMSREDVPQTLRGKRGVIFGNIEKLYDFHKHHFLKELLACEQEPFRTSQCFLDHEKEFLMYALYNKNKPRSDCLMIEHGSTFFRELQTTLEDKMDLSSYLLKPVQRMGKYALILKQILKECPETAAEHQDLTAAQEMIKFCLQHGNDLLAMDSLKECDVNLQEQGTLLLQEEFTVQKSRHKAAKRHLFLFDDLLVFAKAKKVAVGQDVYIYKSSLKVANAQIKNKWVATFEKILWTQAIKNRESRLTELSSMGIGHKPSLDLKPSEDNISARTINTDLIPKANQRKFMQGSGECETRSIKSPLSQKPSNTNSCESTSSEGSSHLPNKLTAFAPTTRSFPFGHSSSASSLSSHSTSNNTTSRHSDGVSVSALHLVSPTSELVSAPKVVSMTSPSNSPRLEKKKDNTSPPKSTPSSSKRNATSAHVLTLLEEPTSLYESKV